MKPHCLPIATAICLWLGCSAPENQPAASPADGAGQPSTNGPPTDGVTYFALDSAPGAFKLKGISGLKLSATDGAKFGTAIRESGTIIFSVRPPTGDSWYLDLRAPHRAAFAAKKYQGATSPGGDQAKPWLDLTGGSSGSFRSSGWFRVYESKFAPNNKRIDRFSVDFVVVEEGGATSFGRLRLRATVDPVPSADDIVIAMYGADVLAKQKLGYELASDVHVSEAIHIFRRMYRRNPKSVDELKTEVLDKFSIDLPDVPTGHELWYDAAGGRFYFRPAADRAE
jgi:hypothetical protein